ncbi:hypothetical protein HPB49_017944 [Dermacentor silvarum]|uniref:Uncharacterized protein n=1 Tax=Dermacentor silvarum TaxID=543639 RepID=A0ACB8CSK9_DERSI|nr:hypothetical protein HPB49_017944 [Dermacentor silvarum]
MGTIKDLSRFDAQFFGVPPRQANVMDPQLRLLLETSYEAIVDAGYDPSTMRGHRVGVFAGCIMSETRAALNVDVDEVDGHTLVDNLSAMLANRVSYAFDFNGPSFTVDTASSSTMTALNQAVLALRSGQCTAAIVGGANLILDPVSTLNGVRLGILSPDGKCKSFDSSGDGYARSETVGAIFIQRASQARRVYAKLIHIKANADGYKIEGITFPSSKAQELLMREVYAEANIDPSSVCYVEAHGTGTQAGDPAELNSIASVFCQSRRGGALKVGSVKSNLGHAEGASGVCSLAKVILAMETGEIAPNLHFNEPNPHIPSLRDGRIEVVNAPTFFPGGLVGINSFGIGGANVHVILEGNRGEHVDCLTREAWEVPRLVLMAGRTKDSLQKSLKKLEEEGPYPDSAYALLNSVGQPSVKRFPYRGYAVVPVDGTQKHLTKVVERSPSDKRPLWFVFTGMGCQWPGMAKQMMQFDTFARAIHESHKLLETFGFDLLEILTSNHAGTETVTSAFTSIVAIQVGLVELLRAVGLQPDGIVGHSLGEIGCGYADGCLTAEEAVLCAFWRGRCIDQAGLPKGAMAAIGLGHCVRTSRSRSRVGTNLRAQNVFAREVNSMNVALHNSQLQSVGPPLRQALEKVIVEPRPRSERWISSSVPETKWDEPIAQLCSSDYFVNNLLSPVLFCEALRHVPSNAILVEVAPHCLLQTVLRRAVSVDAKCLSLMKKDSDNHSLFLHTLGALHTLGIQLDPSKLYPPVPWPVPRGTPNIAHLVSWDHSHSWRVVGWRDFPAFSEVSENVIEIDIGTTGGDSYLAHHQVDNHVLFPASGILMLAWKSLTKRTRFRVNIMRSSGDFEVHEAGILVASGRIHIAEDECSAFHKGLPVAPPETLLYELNSEDIYKELKLRGYEYRSSFKGIVKADVEGPYGKLSWQGNWVTFIESMFQFTIFKSQHRNLILPVGIEYCRIEPQVQSLIPKGCKGVDVVYSNHTGTCRAGGVVIRGLKGNTVQRHIEQDAPVLQEYHFVPHVD